MAAARATLGIRMTSDVGCSGTAMLSVGDARPERAKSAGQLGAPFGRDAAWIHTRTGIHSVRRTDNPSEIGRLAARATSTALRRAHLAATDIDLLLTASCSLDQGALSAIAAQVAPGSAWLAINAACSGFCIATSTADSFIRTGAAQRVLVLAVEHMSALLDPADLGTSIIFGDGAGAAVFGPAADGEPGIGPVVWGSDGSRGDLIASDPSGLLRMSGPEVFRWAVESMPAIAQEACDRAGVDISEIEVFVPHQANGRIIDAIAAKLGLHNAVVARDIASSGNTSAASIPMAMSRLLERDATLSGKLGLLLGFGAGLAYAAQVVRLP
jgi:3-oxoacyl-[acyl-carrier-protein] synthase-3